MKVPVSKPEPAIEPTPAVAPAPPRPTTRKLAPIAGAVTSLSIALLLRQVLGGVGLGEPNNLAAALNVAGVISFGAAMAYWAGRFCGRLPAAFILGALAGIASACFAHETIPAIAGGVIVGFFALRFLSHLISWVTLYLIAVIYGGGIGVGAHYLITQEESWGGYPKAGLAVLVGVGLAAYLASNFGEEERERRLAFVWNTWLRVNRLALVGSVMLGLSGSLYALRGQDLNELADRVRQPIEERIADFQEVSEKVDQAREWKDDVDRMLGRDEAGE